MNTPIRIALLGAGGLGKAAVQIIRCGVMGALEAAACLVAMDVGFLHPTLHCDDPEPASAPPSPSPSASAASLA